VGFRWWVVKTPSPKATSHVAFGLGF